MASLWKYIQLNYTTPSTNFVRMCEQPEKKKEKGSERNYAFHFNLLERGNFNRLDKFSGDVNRS